MCGIVTVINNNNKKASKSVFKRYKEQEKRGTQGYGAVAIEDNKVARIYRSEDEKGIRQIHNDTAPVMLFHHRTPTSTPNLEDCTHPIFVSNDTLDHDYLVVHNGVISNDITLKTEFEKAGFKYTTTVCQYYKTRDGYKPNGREVFNDSESLAIDLAIAIEEGSTKTKAYGSIAFVVLQYRKDNKELLNIFYGRNDRNPLVLDTSNGNIIIASEGYGDSILAHRLFKMSMPNRVITDRAFDIGFNIPVVEKRLPIYHPVYRNNLPKEVVIKDKIVPPPLTKITIHVEDEHGADHWVDLMTRYCLVHRTHLDIAIISHVTYKEWQRYFEVYKEIDSYDELTKSHKEYNFEFTEEDLKQLGSEYKRLYTELNSWSKRVVERSQATGLIDNKF